MLCVTFECYTAILAMPELPPPIISQTCSVCGSPSKSFLHSVPCPNLMPIIDSTGEYAETLVCSYVNIVVSARDTVTQVRVPRQGGVPLCEIISNPIPIPTSPIHWGTVWAPLVSLH